VVWRACAARWVRRKQFFFEKKAPPDRREPKIPGCLEPDLSTARKHFFLKKEAKTFAHLAYALGQRERLIIKSFCFLFQKEVLSLLYCTESGDALRMKRRCYRA
jgi:hypothetical protein